MNRIVPGVISCDTVVIGAGAAGLATALRLSARRRVILLCKTPLGSGAATAWAQGGIAAAIGDDDSPALHVHDTEEVGGGINDHRVVEILARDAAKRVTELIALGAAFDRDADGELSLGREAAHSRRRILHAGGDATGREILRALVEAVHASPIRVVQAHAREIIVDRGRAHGIIARSTAIDGAPIRIAASAVVLATGGCGRLFSYTTNPAESTGDGLAMAARAGAEFADLEFVQFHPTALAAGIDPMPLLTEALRGEGARLIDRNGASLMDGRDPRGDLAPRDIVARVIFEHVAAGTGAYLDARAIENFDRRFPTVWTECRAAGLDPRSDILPIAPAAHYHMGGVAVDAFGRSSIRGLWACGETASTGAHGANRLASNSLLEALVFGARTADDVLSRTVAGSRPVHLPRFHADETSDIATARILGDNGPAPVDAALHAEMLAAVTELRATMYENVGLVRDANGLQNALSVIARLRHSACTRGSSALEDLLTVAELIAGAALDRRESRGSHYRRDFPQQDPAFGRRVHGRAAAFQRG